MRYGVLALALVATLAALPAAGAPAPRRSTLAPGWDEHSVRWSPDGSSILIQRDYEPPRGGSWFEIAVVRPDGSGRRQLGRRERRDFEEWDFVGAWSPDGRRVAFARRVGLELDRVYVINADGSGQRRLTPQQLDASEFSPSWSPDGRRLVFARGLSSGTAPEGLFTISADGGDLRQVTRGDDEFDPVWSPDGDLIAFVRLEGGSSSVYVVRPDGSGLKRLGPGSEPAWSPDSARILVLRSGGLHAMQRDGSGSTRVASGAYGSWSPDGTRIAFRRGGSVYVAPVGGGAPRLVHRGARSPLDRPAWSPDGRRLAFGDRGPCLALGVYVLELATRNLTRITNDCRIVGSGRVDALRGTRERDVVRGLAGSDFVDGNPGDRPNEYAGRDDDDLLDGGPGADVLWGRRGTDVLLGGPGSDRLRGGRGTDRLAGGTGDDFLDGGRYHDRLDGGSGDDAFSARDGFRDTIRCGAGYDRVSADRTDVVAADCELVTRAAA